MTYVLMETEQMVEGHVVRVADHARLGVPELVFINLRKGEIRLLRLNDGCYEQTILTSDPVVFQSMGGLILQAEWILTEPRPDEFDTLSALLAAKRL